VFLKLSLFYLKFTEPYRGDWLAYSIEVLTNNEYFLFETPPAANEQKHHRHAPLAVLPAGCLKGTSPKTTVASVEIRPAPTPSRSCAQRSAWLCGTADLERMRTSPDDLVSTENPERSCTLMEKIFLIVCRRKVITITSKYYSALIASRVCATRSIRDAAMSENTHPRSATKQTASDRDSWIRQPDASETSRSDFSKCPFGNSRLPLQRPSHRKDAMYYLHSKDFYFYNWIANKSTTF